MAQRRESCFCCRLWVVLLALLAACTAPPATHAAVVIGKGGRLARPLLSTAGALPSIDFRESDPAPSIRVVETASDWWLDLISVTYGSGEEVGGGARSSRVQRLELDVAGGEFIASAEMAVEAESLGIAYLRLVTSAGRELVCGRMLTDTTGRVVRDEEGRPRPMLGQLVDVMPAACGTTPGRCELAAIRGTATTYVHSLTLVWMPRGNAATGTNAAALQ